MGVGFVRVPIRELLTHSPAAGSLAVSAEWRYYSPVRRATGR